MNITQNIIRLDSTRGAYCYLLYAEELVLIDTGLPFFRRRIKKELRALGIALTDIKHIFLTHHDVDHVGNLKWFYQESGAKIWAHKLDIPYITGLKERPGFKKYIGRLARTNQIANVSPFPESSHLKGIEILHVPGHTPGHTCFLFEETFFAGDLVEEKNENLIPYPDAWNWNTALMLENIQKLGQKNLRFKRICLAHGNITERDSLPL